MAEIKSLNPIVSTWFRIKNCCYCVSEQELLLSERFQGVKKNYSQIAEKNARELINEEERAKNKAEGKKAKKKRQRQKKLMNKVDDPCDIPTKNNNDNNDNTNNSYTEMENLSLNSDK